MKKLFITLMSLVCIITCTTAQQKNSGYLFEEFQQAKVIHKDGKVYQVELNYDFMNGDFVFIDVHDNNEIKLFADPQNVAAIQIEDRIFLATKHGATEVVQNNPPIHVQYKGKVRLEDKKAAYGGRSATASIQSYSGFVSEGRWHQLEGDGSILAGISKKFTINKDGKKRSFINQKQFLKIYQEKKSELTEYIKANQVDFNSIGHVIELCNYAASL